MPEYLKRNTAILTDEQVEDVERRIDETETEHEVLGFMIFPCACGHFVASMAIGFEKIAAFTVMTVHLPEDVDVARALRNVDSVQADVMVNGEAVSEDTAKRWFPALDGLKYTQIQIAAVRKLNEVESLFADERERTGKKTSDLHA